MRIVTLYQWLQTGTVPEKIQEATPMRISLPALAGLATTASLIASAAHASTFQTLYEFAGGADGATPYGKLVMDKAGTLYGVTVNGGTASRGTVFSLDPVSLTLTSLYSFSGADGSNPQSGLVLDGKGNLYGVTPSGGSTPHCSSGCGTVFKLNIASGKLKTFVPFYRPCRRGRSRSVRCCSTPVSSTARPPMAAPAPAARHRVAAPCSASHPPPRP
ncbi:MAG: choice-of-anchor tandem repeat GloVer-containing protein [Rhodospirillales bacterium]